MGTIRRKSNMKFYECFTQGNAEEQGIPQGVLILEMPHSKVIALHLHNLLNLGQWFHNLCMWFFYLQNCQWISTNFS